MFLQRIFSNYHSLSYFYPKLSLLLLGGEVGGVGGGGGGPGRQETFVCLPLAALIFMTYFYRTLDSLQCESIHFPDHYYYLITSRSRKKKKKNNSFKLQCVVRPHSFWKCPNFPTVSSTMTQFSENRLHHHRNNAKLRLGFLDGIMSKL